VTAVTRCPLPAPRPPRRLLHAIPPGSGARLLEGCGPDGWRTPPGGSSRQTHLLALEPEVEFRGGLVALEDAARWLADLRSEDADAALLIGSLAYDLGRAFERIPERALEDVATPAVCLAGFRAFYRYDPTSRRGEIVGSDRAQVRRVLDRVRGLGEGTLGGGTAPMPLGAPRPRTSDAEHVEAVARAKRWIAAGDVYQVNLSRRLDFDDVSPSALPALYDAVTSRAPAPFSAYLDAGDFTVLSNSPERFLRVSGRRVETCPIKGTRPRGRSLEEDRWLAKELLSSEKDRAEHLMIVDLERNDLGRVCETGSVRVRELGRLRSFPTVHHLVSAVEGRLRSRRDWIGLLRACFPGGSITGAPKLRAMEIIEELEPVRRGIYTGALGAIDAAGGVDLSIAIRTAIARAGRLYLQLGGGIVADSDAEAELRETVDKGRAFAALWEGAA
jgi:para-aminobenzoate synthetase component 1